jgi:hypothetical protein
MTAGAKSAVAAVAFKNALRVDVIVSSPCRDAGLLSKNHAIVGVFLDADLDARLLRRRAPVYVPGACLPTVRVLRANIDRADARTMCATLLF